MGTFEGPVTSDLAGSFNCVGLELGILSSSNRLPRCSVGLSMSTESKGERERDTHRSVEVAGRTEISKNGVGTIDQVESMAIESPLAEL